MKSIHKALVLAVVVVPMFFPWRDATAQNWPQIKVPQGIRLAPLGDRISQNGLPMRLQAFVTSQPADELLAWFQSSLGKRHVVDKVGNTTVIGQAQGNFYLSVQLTAGEKGTHGVVAVSRIKSVAEAIEHGRPLVSVVPGESRLISDTGSVDGSKHGRHIVYANHYSQEVNRELMVEFMKEKGYRLEHQVRLEERPGQAFFFRDGEREAMAVISQQGHEAIAVINMVSPVRQAAR